MTPIPARIASVCALIACTPGKFGLLVDRRFFFAGSQPQIPNSRSIRACPYSYVRAISPRVRRRQHLIVCRAMFRLGE